MAMRDDSYEFAGQNEQLASPEQLDVLERVAQVALEETSIEIREQHTVAVVDDSGEVMGYMMFKSKFYEEDDGSDGHQTAVIITDPDVDHNLLEIELDANSSYEHLERGSHALIVAIVENCAQQSDDPYVASLLRRLKQVVYDDLDTSQTSSFGQQTIDMMNSLIDIIVRDNSAATFSCHEIGHIFDGTHTLIISSQQIVSEDPPEDYGDMPKLGVHYQDRDSGINYTYILGQDGSRKLYIYDLDNSAVSFEDIDDGGDHTPTVADVEMLTQKTIDMIAPSGDEFERELEEFVSSL